MTTTDDAASHVPAEDPLLRREMTYRKIARRLREIDDGSGRRTRYYFAAIFIQENSGIRAYSSREVEQLWQRWLTEG